LNPLATSNHDHDPRRQLRRMVDHAAHLLPAQGPIGVFIHHNTLHSFQHLPFEQAVMEASRLYGTEPYLSEDAYRKEFDAGRIMAEDIREVVRREPDAVVIPGRLQRHALREALLNPGARPVDPRTLAVICGRMPPWRFPGMCRKRSGLPVRPACLRFQED